MATPESFQADIDRFAAKARENARLIAATSLVMLNENVVEATPASFRPAWRAAINTEVGGRRGAGGEPVAVAREIKIGDVFHAANTDFRARFVEFGTRPHAIAPKKKRARRGAAHALHFAGRFAEHVAHPGVAPRPFLRTPLAQWSDYVEAAADVVGRG